ncbi:MAG TPA: prepilin-type N-terminal cleavage/methylation domain-containing protein [Tepidisphaeraceae bacterium]|nr:prepilin-type N-terminal cleavage/methylation domain-containing protein [Tepidisphaeraceae bacterium]
MTTPAPRHARGFTLVELLIVIGIVGLLIGLLTAVVMRAANSSKRTAGAAQLQMIATALEAYKTDFGDYPRPALGINPATGTSYADVNNDHPNPPNGAQILCRALIAPFPAVDAGPIPANNVANQDGLDGPGFRLRGTQGQQYKGYLPADKFKLSEPIAGAGSLPDGSATLVDGNGKAILYLPARRPVPDIRAVDGFIASNSYTSATPRPLFNFFDLRADVTDASIFRRPGETTDNQARARVRGALGELNLAAPSSSTDCNGRIDNGETPATDAAYLLWTAGSDGVYGPEISAASSPFAPTRAELKACDDVANFTLAGQ